MEILYEGPLLIPVLLFIFGIGVLGVISLVIVFRQPSSSEVLQHMEPQPLWQYYETTTVEHKKPVRRRSLPYGAYGTDITRRKRGRKQ